MNAVQNSFFHMLAAVRVVTDSFEPVWRTVPSFADPYETLKAEVLEALPGMLARQAQTTTGVTTDKAAVRADLEARLLRLGGAVEAYAITGGNNSLRANAHLTPSGVGHLTEEALVGAATRIAALAAEHRASLSGYKVTGAAIAGLRNAAAGYARWIGKPRSVQVTKRGGTEGIEALRTEGRRLLDILDAQMVLFGDGHPDFCSQYATARALVSPATRHRAISFRATDAAGRPLENVAIAVPALALAKRTGVSGACYVQNAPAGLYVGTATKQGFRAQDLRISVNDGETAQVTVVLTPMA